MLLSFYESSDSVDQASLVTNEVNLRMEQFEEVDEIWAIGLIIKDYDLHRHTDFLEDHWASE